MLSLSYMDMTTNDQELYRSLGRVESKLDSVLDFLKAVDKRVESQETRLKAVETWRATFRGSMTAIAAVASVVVSILTSIFLKRM